MRTPISLDALKRLTASNADIDGVRALFISALLVTFLLEVIAAVFAGNGHGLAFLLLNSTAGGAAAFSGALLGFVFGIPRALAEQRNGPLQINTNLEQISDWLTKILVGAGLTSLTGFPEFAGRVVVFLDGHDYNGVLGGGMLAVFLMVYFGALGFFWSYIETRTTLTDLFGGNTDQTKSPSGDFMKDYKAF
jgi:hypothetical protein